jgi:hypothetical protein
MILLLALHSKAKNVIKMSLKFDVEEKSSEDV